MSELLFPATALSELVTVLFDPITVLFHVTLNPPGANEWNAVDTLLPDPMTVSLEPAARGAG